MEQAGRQTSWMHDPNMGCIAPFYCIVWLLRPLVVQRVPMFYQATLLSDAICNYTLCYAPTIAAIRGG